MSIVSFCSIAGTVVGISSNGSNRSGDDALTIETSAAAVVVLLANIHRSWPICLLAWDSSLIL